MQVAMSSPERINTIILEDCRFSNIILQYFCESHQNIHYNGSFEDVYEAIPYIQSNAVDLIFLDIELKQSNGFDVLKYLNPKTIVVLTSHNPDYFQIAQKNGVRHFLPKPFALENFLRIIQTIKQDDLQRDP